MKIKRKTKIVCTLGPSTDSYKMIEKMIIMGMDAARLNFSHGTHNQHLRVIKSIREISQRLNKPVAIIQDLSGPKIRIGKLKKGSIILNPGEDIDLVTTEVLGDKQMLSLPYPEIKDLIRLGQNILLDDGMIEMKVIKKENEKIRCRVIRGGILTSRKGVHIPGLKLSWHSLTEKDKENLMFGLKNKVDYVALSYVKNEDDIKELKDFINKNRSSARVIAKIEREEAVKNIDKIIKEADIIMIARGDLGVELPIDYVPLIQKMIIEKCRKNGTPVITATQMLESMRKNPLPTRAEVTDVANAILDGTDAVMLSGETAMGDYPEEALKIIQKIAHRVEKTLDFVQILREMNPLRANSITDAICHATCELAQDLGASAIITSTSSGYTSRMVSKYRPSAPIIAVTPDKEVLPKLTLYWGVIPVLVKKVSNTDMMINLAIESAVGNQLVKKGDVVVITLGIPFGIQGKTNLIKAHLIGEEYRLFTH